MTQREQLDQLDPLEQLQQGCGSGYFYRAASECGSLILE